MTFAIFRIFLVALISAGALREMNRAQKRLPQKKASIKAIRVGLAMAFGLVFCIAVSDVVFHRVTFKDAMYGWSSTSYLLLAWTIWITLMRQRIRP